MKPTRGSIQIAAIGAACIAVIACRSHDREAPNGDAVSLTSAPVTLEAPAVTAPEPEPAVCAPSDGETLAAAVPAPSPAPAARATRASSRAVVAGASAKPNRALNDAIAQSAQGAEAADDRNVTARAGAPNAEALAPTAPAEEVAASQPVSVTTTTGATVPVARPAATLAPARVIFENRLPSTYQLERARVLVDGAVVYDGAAPGSVWIAPGAHAVQLVASYRLNDPVFTYVRGYRIDVQSTERVPASATPLAVVASAQPRGGVTTPVNEAAGVVWRSFPMK